MQSAYTVLLSVSRIADVGMLLALLVLSVSSVVPVGVPYQTTPDHTTLHYTTLYGTP